MITRSKAIACRMGPVDPRRRHWGAEQQNLDRFWFQLMEIHTANICYKQRAVYLVEWDLVDFTPIVVMFELRRSYFPSSGFDKLFIWVCCTQFHLGACRTQHQGSFSLCIAFLLPQHDSRPEWRWENDTWRFAITNRVTAVSDLIIRHAA
jgi:hypothetical protein